MDQGEGTVLEQYGTGDLCARVEQALARAGLDRAGISWSELAPLDQFHVRGLAATRELAAGLELIAGVTVLDVGCGLGGPARYLAAQCGAMVTGIDLSQPFVAVARMLTERAGLADRARFQQADALELPFAEASFDHVWTQHVAMNIADRTGFYDQIHRVLKPGGRLALYDVVAGEGGPLIFPVPWAKQPEISHLLGAPALREVLDRCGFTVETWTDQTDAGLAWFGRPPAAAPALGLQLVMGPDFPAMTRNLARNLKEGRAGLIQAILRRT